jgi:hypothetical protein
LFAALFESGDTLFENGNAIRELSHSPAALVRCAGNGRGASRRSGRGAAVMRRAVAECPAPQQFRPRRIGQQCRQVFLPQRQVTACQVFGVAHPLHYIPMPPPRKRAPADAHGFDAAIAPRRYIVMAGKRSLREMARA